MKKTLAVLRRKRDALVGAHEAKLRALGAEHEGELRAIDAAIDGIERYGVGAPDMADVAPVPVIKPPARSKVMPAAKSKKRRAPRGHVPRIMEEAFRAQPGPFSVREIRAFLEGRYPEDSRRLSAHRLSNEMHNAAEKNWIKLVTSQKGGPNTYMKHKLPPQKQ